MKKKKIIILIIGIVILLMMAGVTYSFFNYTRTGESNTITVGRIAFRTDQLNTINITNLFPIDPTENGIMDDETKVGAFEIEIEGDTDYSEGIEYLVSVVNANVYTNDGNVIPVSLDVSLSGLGDESSSYFTARNNKNANIYKKISGNTIVGDQKLLVGYIKPNTNKGVKEGVNGSITIKAYLDKNKILITDTYDGTESDRMGTKNSRAKGKMVVTTSEWNALRGSGISFQIQVEANEGIWVREPFYNTLTSQAVMDNVVSTNVTKGMGIDFSKVAGDTDNDNILDNGQGLYKRAGTENNAYPIMYYRGQVDNNNVFFANKCWKIIRTTNTGGIKLIYNGVNTGTTLEPSCANQQEKSSVITVNIEENYSSSAYYAGPGLYDSPAYAGYMYGTEYKYTNGNYTSGAYFGQGFTYDAINNTYTLTNPKVDIDENHHYTCNLTNANGTCASIRYYFEYFSFGGNANYYLYFTLSNGKSIEDIFDEMYDNEKNSYVKNAVDTWYENNMLDYTSKIEDTVYCNDRSIYQLGGFNPNGGALNGSTISYSVSFTTGDLIYGVAQRNDVGNPSINCARKKDSFTVSNVIGNGALTYPVGLINMDEISLAGIAGNVGVSNYLASDSMYWTMSPYEFIYIGYSIQGAIKTNGQKVGSDTGSSSNVGIRPVIALKYDNHVFRGDGTLANPYIVE